jgi:rhomboid protease GluP
MSSFKYKFKYIFLPFLLIGIGFIGLYTFLNWFLFIKLDLFPIKEGIRNFGIPLILSLVFVHIWLKPRIRLLKVKDNDHYDNHLHYEMIAAALIFLPAFIAQEYITTASGKLTQLESINSISQTEKTKFYTIKNYYASKRHIGSHVETEVTGSHDDNLRVSLFITLPIYESKAASKQKKSPAWLGIKYSERIDNHLSDEEKMEKYDAFLDEVSKDLASKNVQEFVYLDRLGHSDDLNGYKEALKESSRFHTSNDIILIPIHEPFEARNGNKLQWIFLSFFLDALLWLTLLLFLKFDEEKLDKFFKGNPKETEEKESFITFFIPRNEYFVTPILVNLNILIFLLLFFSGHGFMSIKASDLMQWGANYGPSIMQGEYWRLLSSTFLHAGIIHIFANMANLIYVGLFLEPILGKMKFASAYLLSGIAGSLASIYWHDATVSVGASGAIFGLNGLFIILILTDTLPAEFSFFPRFNSPLLLIPLLFVIANLTMGFFSNENVDNAGHIGGLCCGVILGLVLAVMSKINTFVSTER